ncbi:GIY-YIG nuclease family protein [Algibacter agarivorans]|uniref:GIY-YIG nuclease family protein n=1 Tax=Algibacter agarivorans TaxID=1109741 RepID=A0ABP9GL18_9FLAO
MKKSYVYFLTNKNKTVVYIGVTSNLVKRVYQHKTKQFKGFTSKYNCDILVYYEEFSDINEAILREKQLKAGNRKRKEDLINSMNPEWNDLSEGWLFYFDQPSLRGKYD